MTIAAFLLALDIAFAAGTAEIIFGNASFLLPPATEQVKGIARLAPQARVDAVTDGDDDAETIVTPKTLRARLTALLNGLTDSFGTIGQSIDGLKARRVIAAGLVKGGGDLTADRTFRVDAATKAEILAGTVSDKAITPAALFALQAGLPAGVMMLPNGWIMQTGEFTIGSGTNVVGGTLTFPLTFPNQCFCVVGSPKGPANSHWSPLVVTFDDDAIAVTGAGYTVDTAKVDELIAPGKKVRFIALGR